MWILAPKGYKDEGAYAVKDICDAAHPVRTRPIIATVNNFFMSFSVFYLLVYYEEMIY